MTERIARVTTRVALILIAALAPRPAAAQGPDAPDTMSLGRAIQTALENSRTLADAEYGLRAAKGLVREAWASALPDIQASASYQRNFQIQEVFLPAIIFDPTAPPDALIPARFGSENTWQAALTVSQPLFQAEVFIGIGAAGRFRDLQEETVRGTAQRVVSAVRQAYFDALLAHEELRLTRESIGRVRRTLEDTRARNRAGLVSDYDVLRLEVQLANLEANLRRAENAVEARRRALLVETGTESSRPIALEGRLGEMDLADPERNVPGNAELLAQAGAAAAADRPLDELLTVAMQRRSDLRQLRSTVSLEETRAAVERAAYFPKLSVFSNYNVSAQQNGSPNFFGAGPDQRTTSAAAGLRVEVPVFSGFARAARVQQARASVRQNEARLERVEQEASNQVRTLHADVQEARQRAAAQRRAVGQARRGFEIASAEYRAGVGSQLQVTDAEVALSESEFNYARAVYDYLTARAQLELAIGTVPDVAGQAVDGAF